MDRITGSSTIDIGGGRRGFRGRDAVAGIAGTEVTADWLNDLQEELMAVIERAGFTGSTLDVQQLLRAIRTQRPNYVVAGGTANALTLVLDPAPATLDELLGTPIRFHVHVSNGGATTLKVNDFAALPLRMYGGSDMIANQLVPGIVEAAYDGTVYQVLSLTPSVFSRGGYQWFANSTSWTVPQGVFYVTAEVLGAGGGGGGTSVTGAAATGGNGGAFAVGRYAVTPGQVIPITVGLGGGAAAAGAQNGFAGGASSFGSYVTANGGYGGIGSGGGVQTIIQPNATTSGANIIGLIGSQAQPAYQIGTTLVMSPGGPPPNGGYTDRAGYSNSSPIGGSYASLLGQGGGGGLGGSAPGGAGASGYIKITY
ncbi:hypothetical protein [Azorhizobium doebereinerae]|uniref:glycine-rich domain-containing protein n=1 Tax=Azorhizobium doebereinerae TaxID=281091 RepID=UPI00042A0E1F|nr:hypothetical protein [Azorhizobium doebereinerae]